MSTIDLDYRCNDWIYLNLIVSLLVPVWLGTLCLLIMILLVLLLRFDITEQCVGMHSLQINNYSNVLLLHFVYKSVINI